MKRSTKVALTLLAPAMAAFGCRQQPPAPPANAVQTVRERTLEEEWAEPGEGPNGEQVATDGTTPANQTTTHRSHGGWWPMFIPWGRSGYRQGYSSSPPVIQPRMSPTTQHTGGSGTSRSTLPHIAPHSTSSPHTSTSTHSTSRSSSSTHVTRGGFGHTGSHHSGLS